MALMLSTGDGPCAIKFRSPSSMKLRLYHFCMVALFAVDDLGPIGTVRGFKFAGTRARAMKVGSRVLIAGILRGRAAALASPMPQLRRISSAKTFIVAAVGAQARQGQLHLFIKLQLFRYDPKRSRTLV